MQRQAPHKNKKSKIQHIDANDLVTFTRSSIDQPKLSAQNRNAICLKDAIFAKRRNLVMARESLPCLADGKNNIMISRNHQSTRNSVHPYSIGLATSSQTEMHSLQVSI